MTHNLQSLWFDQDVEQAYIHDVKSLIENGDWTKAKAKLLADIEILDTPMASQILYLRPEIDGWQEMAEAISEYEGEPITAVHLMLSNDEDLSFENRETVFEPIMEAALYTDEIYPFSEQGLDDIRAEILLPDRPWFGQSEDVEIFLDFLGIGEFNTALLRHKRQYFFRDQMHELDRLQGMADNIVPLPYIEFKLCSMFRNVLFHESIAKMVDEYGLPNNIPILVGTYNMKFDVSCAYKPLNGASIAAKEMAPLKIEIKREIIADPIESEVKTLRQKILAETQAVPDEVETGKEKGFFKRLFSWHKKAA